MATETSTTTVEPTAADPQPDRSLVMPVLHDIERLRGGLTQAANFLHGMWPAGVKPPAPTVYLAAHYNAHQVDELRTARQALEGAGEVEVTLTDSHCVAIVHVGGVRVWVQADLDVWEQAFPGEVTT